MPGKNDTAPETDAARALGMHDEAHAGIVPPLNPSTTYLRDPALEARDGRIYARPDNPTPRPAEALLTRLEEGQDALLFGSGMAAANAVFQALKSGDRVLAPVKIYWALRKYLQEQAQAWGLKVDFIDMTDLGAVRRALTVQPVRLIWIETPANPTWDITDIAAVSALAREAGALVAVDNTVATPVFTRPLTLGADLVMHSATKYLNGHSDVLAGALITARQDQFWDRVRMVRTLGGAMPGNLESWLLLRGMRTLYLRVEKASQNALFLAQALRTHPLIRAVLYPGLSDFPAHDIAARQMQGGFGGMMSLRLKGGEDAARSLAGHLTLFGRATSLGGTESLVEHRFSVEGAGSLAPPDMLRLSIGIENPKDLLNDLLHALDQLK